MTRHDERMARETEEIRDRWTAIIQQWLPAFMDEHPALSQWRDEVAIALHGSTTMGVDDECSDIDFWLLIPQERLDDFDEACDSRFVQVEVDGKIGHLNAESIEGFEKRVASCHMDTIYQLRRAVVLTDFDDRLDDCQCRARQTMRLEVARALFFYHYVEMRGEHRACDNPMERGDAVAVLLSLSKTLAHAMQAALALDGEPYPYDKWLRRAAYETETGRRLQPSIDNILELLAEDGLRFPGVEADNPISRELRVIRQTLIDAAHEHGVNEPWLRQWWLHMDPAREAFESVRW